MKPLASSSCLAVATRPWRPRRLLGWLAAGIVSSSIAAPASADVRFSYSNSGTNASNTADHSETGPRRQFRSQADHGPHEDDRCCFVYRSVLAVDVAAFGNVETEVATSSYWIEFDVTADSPTEPWRVELASHRRGDVNIINDGGSDSHGGIQSPISATYSISSGGGSGTLSLLQFGTVTASNSGQSGSDVHENIEQAGVDFIDGVGSRRVRVDFSWWASAVSGGGVGGGDEAAVRLGLATTGLNRVAAGDYWGSPARNPDLDGHFVCATFCPQPSTSITASTTNSCAGSPVLLTAVGGSGGQAEWFSNCCCGTPIAATGRTIQVNPTQTTTYFVRWKPGATCSSSACDPNPELAGCSDSPCSPGITVHVVAQPVAPLTAIASPATICRGSSTTLITTEGSGATQRWYTGSCGGTLVPFTGSAITVSPTVTTTYYTRFESPPCGPTPCRSVTVTVVDPPVAPTAVTPSTSTICSGSPVTLTAVGGSGQTLHWSTDSCGGTPLADTTTTITKSPTTTTTYYAHWTSVPCGDTVCASAVVNVVQPPLAPSISVSSNAVCEGTPVMLQAFGGSGATVKWYSGPCNAETFVGSGTPLFVTPPTGTTSYHARYASPPCGESSCSSSETVVVSPAPALPSIQATSTTVCADTSVTLTALGGSGTTLRWYANSCGGPLVGTGPSVTVVPVANPSLYFARWETATCADGPCASVSITVNPTPVMPASILVDTNPVCAGQPVTLTADGGSGTTVRWFADACGSASLGTGPSIVVTPAATTTYLARWETATCGESDCRTVVVVVNEPPVAPGAATASSTSICAGDSTLLGTLGGSGQVLQWRAGSPTSPPFYSGPATSIWVAPTTDTTYFASYLTAGCAESDPASIAVSVSNPPQNDACVDAIALAVGTAPASVITAFTTRCATTDGPTHADCAYYGDPQIGQDIWFRYQAPAEGSLRLSTCYPAVTAFDTRIAVYEGLGCPVDDARLINCGDDSGAGCAPGTTVNVRVGAGLDYLIRVGGRGAASGDGQLSAQLTVSPPCPPPGTLHSDTYTLCGVATGVSWQWRIRATNGGFATLEGTANAVAAGGTAFQLASSFASSINAAVASLPSGCAGNLSAGALLFGLTNCGGTPSGTTGPAGISISRTIPVELWVFDSTNSSWCKIDSDPTTTICHFNPVAEQVPIPDDDCNRNGLADLIDVFLGTSTDADANLIPDECGIPAGTPYCFGDGSGIGCPCGNNSPVGIEAGCRNSLGLSGRLAGFGVASLQNDSLVLEGEGMPNSSALYFQGTTQTATAFGDGLRCAGGSVLRLGTVVNSGNSSAYPSGGAPAISVRGQVTAPGSVRTYQVWYRNAAAFCSAATFNLTNAVSVSWSP